MGEMHALMLVREAEFQAREHQEGVDASQGYLTTNAAGVLFEGPRTFVCHFKYEAGSRLQGIAGFTVPMMALEIAPSTNLLRFYCGTISASATAPIVPGNNYQAVISYDGTTAVCYLNGSEAARFTVAGYAVTNVFRIGNPSYPPVGPVYSSSHFNYVLSAEEVSALYNNGDPAGYVLPAEMKSGERRCVAEYLPQDLVESPHGDPVEIVGENSYTWTGADDSVYAKILDTSRPSVYRVAYKINVTVSNYEAGAPYLSVTGGYGSVNIPAKNGTFDVIALCDDNRSHVFAYYGGYQNTDRRLTITINSIEPVPGVASSWLDSAKHLPLNDEYLPPLLETAGGYDLTANGAPEIIYKMTQRAYIIPDLMDDGTASQKPFITLFLGSELEQAEASYKRSNGKILYNNGSYSAPINRPMIICDRYNFVAGRYYRVTLKWTLTTGAAHVVAYGDWSNDTYTNSSDPIHAELGSYEWVSPLLVAASELSVYTTMYLYLETSAASTDLSIDEIIIEEYE